MSPEFVNWLRVAGINGVACSVDGTMAVVCNYRHVRTLKIALIWTLLITFFHELFGCAAAWVTFEARGYFSWLVIARIVGILATGWFAWKALNEAIDPDDEFQELRWWDVLGQTAILGSVDAGTFSHAGVVHLTAFGLSGIMWNWTLSALIVGVLTMVAGGIAARGGDLLKNHGATFLVLGAVLRCGLFFGLIILLLISFGENLRMFHLPHWVKIGLELLAISGIALALYPNARKAQMERMRRKNAERVTDTSTSFDGDGNSFDREDQCPIDGNDGASEDPCSVCGLCLPRTVERPDPSRACALRDSVPVA